MTTATIIVMGHYHNFIFDTISIRYIYKIYH